MSSQRDGKRQVPAHFIHSVGVSAARAKPQTKTSKRTNFCRLRAANWKDHVEARADPIRFDPSISQHHIWIEGALAMTQVQVLARFVERARFQELSDEAVEQLKIRVLDTLGVAIGAHALIDVSINAAECRSDGETSRRAGCRRSARPVRKLTAERGGRPLSTLIGGGQTAPDRAAFFNGALSWYLDFMDSYLAKGETCHPSDNVGAVLAAAEMRGARGRIF
jgi:2-methylcitrate dehydratase PrpD